MKIVLIQPPHGGREPSQFPLGIGYIAGPVKRIGCEADFLDIHALKLDKEEALTYIGNSSADVIGINAFSTQYEYVKTLCKEIKDSMPRPIIIGGPLATFNPKLVLEKTMADICVIGEGDETIIDILKNIKNLESVKGIWYRGKNGRVCANEPRENIKDIDSIPFIDYDIFPTNIYFDHMRLFGGEGKRVINITTSRGCPYSCKFCSRTLSGSRLRSIDNVIQEIKAAKTKYGIDGVLFSDELLIGSQKRAFELADKIRPLKLKWGCQGRVDIINKDILKKIKEARCVSIGYGIESGSQKILNNMNKKTTVEQNEKAIRETIKVGMTPVIQMMCGYPGETRETIFKTVELMDRVHCSLPLPDSRKPHLNLTIPLPGSPLYDEIKSKGKITDEEQYLKRISKGYYRGAGLVLNLSELTDSELLYYKHLAERMIYKNFLRYIVWRPWLLAAYMIKKSKTLIRNRRRLWQIK